MNNISASNSKKMRTLDSQKDRYDDSYFSLYRSDPRRSAMYRQEFQRIESLCSSGRILDVGCGIGGFLSEFSPERWERFGIDVSPLAIEEARAKGIFVNDFCSAYDYPDCYFDVIVFRGSLQLIPTPFQVIENCIRLLAPGGHLVFLATPNSNSPYYRQFKTLPFLTPEANFLIPSDIMLRDSLRNFGLEIVDIVYPYVSTPYARLVMDHFLYLISFFGIRRKFAFWRSSMEVYARKPILNP